MSRKNATPSLDQFAGSDAGSAHDVATIMVYSSCTCVAMPRRYLPRIARRKSRLHGWGVFALEPINKNTRIVTYDGELIDHKESFKRETKYLKRGEIWCFTVNRRWVRDATWRQRRAVHQPRLQAELLQPDHRKGHLDPCRPQHRSGRGTHVRLLHGRRAMIQCKCRPGCKRRL